MDSNVVLGLVLIMAILAIYFAPTVVANKRDAQASGSVFLLNLLLGWTVIGWLAALAFALMSPPTVRRRCTHCDEPVRVQATVCPHCRNALGPPPRVPTRFGVPSPLDLTPREPR